TYRWIQSVARAPETAKKLYRLRVPAGDIGGDFLEHAERTLTQPVIDGVGDIEALAARIQAEHQPGIEQRSDIGNHPVIASLDRLVLPQAIDAAAKRGGGGAYAIDQFSQRPIGIELVGVERAIDGGQQVPKFVRIVNRVIVCGGFAHGVGFPNSDKFALLRTK